MGSIRINDKSQNLINTNYQAPISPLSPTVSTNADAHPAAASDTAVKAPTVNLFDQSSYQKTTTVALEDGSTIALPTSTAEDQQTFQTLFASIPDDQKEKLNAASAGLAAAVMAYVQANPGATAASAAAAIPSTTSAATRPSVGGVAKLSKINNPNINGPSTAASAAVADAGPATTYTISQASPDVSGLSVAANAAASTYKAASGNGSYDATVQAVAYMGVQGLQQSLSDYGVQMQSQINNQTTVRTDQNELSSAVADWPSGTATQTFTYHDVDASGNLQTYTAEFTQEQAKAEAENLANTLSTMGSDTQLMQIRLQTMQQNYQQGVTTISNLMKMQYDMVKNTIGNIHY